MYYLFFIIYTSSDLVLSYILAWSPLIDAKDSRGQTALHITVKMCEKYERTRSIRQLLLMGASRYEKDDQGNTPTDLAFDYIKNINFRKEVLAILVNINFC